MGVLIPHHHNRRGLERALASVRGWPALVIDDSPAGLPRCGAPRLRSPGSVGFARAVNLGLEEAGRRGWSHALLLNDDAAPEPGCLEVLREAWTAQDGALGPLLLGAQVEAGIKLSRWGRLRVMREIPEGPCEVPALSGACLLLAVEQRMDPAYRHGMEDIDLCRRLRAQGLRVRLIPAARCQHEGGATLSRRSAEAQRHAVSGHLRLLGGGAYTPVVLGLALAQVLREGGPAARLEGIRRGWSDWRSSRLPPDRNNQ
jgi:hypothetical protein